MASNPYRGFPLNDHAIFPEAAISHFYLGHLHDSLHMCEPLIPHNAVG